MDLQKLAAYGHSIGVIIEGTAQGGLDRAMARIIENEDWDLAGALMLTASEISVQPMVRKLLEREVYEPLVLAACLRRQLRRPGEGVGKGVSGRVFRDWDAEEDGAPVPEHIRMEAEEMTRAANQTRSAMTLRAAEVDRDPIRDAIVSRIAQKLATSDLALEALLTIVKASAWEETRRNAAMKLANHALSISRLARALRTADMIAIAGASGLSAVAANIAKSMHGQFEQLKAAADKQALEFIASNHPDEGAKALARQTLGQ